MTDTMTHDAPAIVPQQPDVHTKRMALLALLDRNPQGLTSRIVATMLGWSPTRTSVHLSQMAAYNLIDREQLPCHGQVRREYLYKAKTHAAKAMRVGEKVAAG